MQFFKLLFGVLGQALPNSLLFPGHSGLGLGFGSALGLFCSQRLRLLLLPLGLFQHLAQFGDPVVHFFGLLGRVRRRDEGVETEITIPLHPVVLGTERPGYLKKSESLGVGALHVVDGFVAGLSNQVKGVCGLLAQRTRLPSVAGRSRTQQQKYADDTSTA